MSVYVSTTYYGDNSKVQDALDELDKLQIHKIEIGSNHAESTEKIKLRSGSTYITHNYFPPSDMNFILNIASNQPAIRDRSIAFMKKSILWCKKNAISHYTIHPGFLNEAVSQHKSKGGSRDFDLTFVKKSVSHQNRAMVVNRVIKIIESLNKYAMSNNVRLLVENEGSQTSAESVIFDTMSELERLKNTIGSTFKFNFNLAHATLSGIDLKNKKTFEFFYKSSEFFEVSEMRGVYDSHLPVFPKRETIGKLIDLYGPMFKKKNLILEYRNIPSSHLIKSYREIALFLDSL